MEASTTYHKQPKRKRITFNVVIASGDFIYGTKCEVATWKAVLLRADRPKDLI